MKQRLKLILVIASLFVIGCCHSGTGFFNKPLQPEWGNIYILDSREVECTDCHWYMNRESLDNYIDNYMTDDSADNLLHAEYEQTIDECNAIIEGD